MDKRLIRIAEALYGLDAKDDDPWNPLPRWDDITEECRYQMLRRAKWCCVAMAEIIAEHPGTDPGILVEKISKTTIFSPHN